MYVLIAAGNEVLRAGIATLIGLRPGFAVSEISVSSIALAEEVRARRPDVLLVDIAMAGSLREFLDDRSQASIADIAVVALASDDLPDMDVLRDLVQRGVDGVVTANDQASQLSGAMQAVYRGRRWLSPAIGGHLLNALARPGSGSSSADAGTGETSLTQRERNVLALVADGLTVSQIAKRLYRSESAVKYHLANMSARYQASNRAHLVYLAIRAGELSIG
ncbi:response regulator transcription factor [Polymorphospora rubra]|uniref:response regulator transcription factor n=1 Tax=Polymorphospora rubra TaxID=338584 RepID=UPI0033C0A1B1